MASDDARSAAAPPASARREWNAALVQLLNGRRRRPRSSTRRLRRPSPPWCSTCSSVLPVMDARDRMATALATTRSELILEAFDRRLESLGRRLEGLLALRDRLETVSERRAGRRGTLARGRRSPSAVAAAAARAADGLRPTPRSRTATAAIREEIRERLAVLRCPLRRPGPVADLGCGRGEFLALLREARHRGPRRRVATPTPAEHAAGPRARRGRGRSARLPARAGGREPGRRLRRPGGRAPAPRRPSGPPRARPTASCGRAGCCCSRP